MCANFGLECIVYMGAKVSLPELQWKDMATADVLTATLCPFHKLAMSQAVLAAHRQQGAGLVQPVQPELASRSSPPSCHPPAQTPSLHANDTDPG